MMLTPRYVAGLSLAAPSGATIRLPAAPIGVQAVVLSPAIVIPVGLAPLVARVAALEARLDDPIAPNDPVAAYLTARTLLI